MLKGLVTLKDLENLLGHLRGDANLLSLFGEVNEYFPQVSTLVLGNSLCVVSAFSESERLV